MRPPAIKILDRRVLARDGCARARQPRGWHQRFSGGRRVNCESAPRLPAWCVRRVLDDPLQSPHLLTWREGEEVARVVRIDVNPDCPWPELRGLEVILTEIEGGRAEGGDFLRGVWQPLPRGGARDFLLICRICGRPRRHLYGWSVFGSSVSSSTWLCRRCAGLRYASEGGALWYRTRFRLFGFSLQDEQWPRPEPWNPELKKQAASPARARVPFVPAARGKRAP